MQLQIEVNPQQNPIYYSSSCETLNTLKCFCLYNYFNFDAHKTVQMAVLMMIK